MKYANSEYERAKTLLGHSRHEYEISRINFLDIKDILQTEICLSSHRNKSSEIKDLLNITKLTTKIELGLKKNMVLDASVVHLPTAKESIIPLSLEVNDVASSLRFAAKRILQDTLCLERRGRRSIDKKDKVSSQDLPFTSWLADASGDVSPMQMACITLQRSVSFLKDVNSKLYTQLMQAESIAEQLAVSRFELEMAASSPDKLQTEESGILRANKDSINAINTVIGNYELRRKPKALIANWIMSSETYTTANNLTVCAGFVDCVETAMQSIRDLPRVSETSSDQLITNIDNLAAIFSRLFTGNFLALEDLKAKVYEVEAFLETLLKTDLHCSELPAVKLLPSKQEINIVEGGTLRLTCDVVSPLPVQIIWKVNNTPIEGVSARVLQLNVSARDAGMYSCSASSGIGASASDATLLRVNVAPRFIVEPKDFIYVTPKSKSVRPYLVCNATAIPSYKIEWFFTPFDDVGITKLPFNESILTIEDPRETASGYYFCRASNDHGSVQSRKARLDLLNSELASQVILFGFDITSKDISKINISAFEIVLNRTSMNQNISAAFTLKDSETGSVVFKMEQIHPEFKHQSERAMLTIAKESRKNLATAMTVVMGNIVKNNFSMSTLEGEVVKIDKDTFVSSFAGNICRPGLTPSEDGFTCGKHAFISHFTPIFW